MLRKPPAVMIQPITFEGIGSAPVASQRLSSLSQEPVRSQWRSVDTPIRNQEPLKPHPESTERFRASDLIRTFRNDKT